MQIKFSQIEIRDLLKAWIAISVAFAIVLSGGVLSPVFLVNILLSALTVGIGFLLHELGHKFVAQRYGCFAEFRADNFMLMIAVLTSFLGVIFAAPGAVMIAGRVSKERNGKISVAGPMVNIVLAVLFLPLPFIFQGGFLYSIGVFGFFVNSWLALFNMLPFWVLDGKKVLAWNKVVYFITLGIPIGFLFLGYQLPFSI
jgi:Zn-dependent protease